MKADEAQEKIWLGKYTQNLMLSDPNSNTYVEYIRKDAFVEKAEEYLYKQLNEGNIECGDIETFIENFRKYMEGE